MVKIVKISHPIVHVITVSGAETDEGAKIAAMHHHQRALGNLHVDPHEIKAELLTDHSSIMADAKMMRDLLTQGREDEREEIAKALSDAGHPTLAISVRDKTTIYPPGASAPVPKPEFQINDPGPGSKKPSKSSNKLLRREKDRARYSHIKAR